MINPALVLGFLKRTWPLLISLTLVLALGISRWQLSNANEKLSQENDFRQSIKTELAAPAADIKTLTATVHARVEESRDRKETLTRISTESLAAKKRAETADTELKRVQAENTRHFAEAKPQIKALDQRKPTGIAEKDAAALEEDSKAAWKGWK